MPELRKDPILGRWIIIAQERGKRPTDFMVEEYKVKGGFCPLCPGHEKTTPDEVLVYGRNEGTANSSGWQTRVVPNKYPALVIEGELEKQGEGLYDRMNGIGAHEVIIENPSHEKTFAALSPEEMIFTFRAFRDRIRDLAQDERFRYVMVFKNFGKAAGASLEHSHSQLVALPIVPRRVSSELEGSLSYYKYKDRCIFCDIIRQERQQDIRRVCENDYFVTITPYAPRSPFEMWIIPRYHHSNYAAQDENSLQALTDIFSESLRRLDACIPNAPYNFVLHTQPLRSPQLDHYHWHFEIVPKLTSIAGFEWGTGFYINPMPPEETCKYLKEVEL
ncbi:galactose-1-phosphate uridylyltransferase [Desulfogranum marinum]|uniref:galactose-1-phosphate uridylyltransferase n=1 Tax=Desulfogranum marinum TaxID=453220 RepID=UPI001962EC16|nr:galactose-1-phosphate uridylyltransferase [Desulfogranum marinum]MBM9513544.1 galactose-1-phosphate uridylyltransferase [Desulfogranum marinum]